jgi:chitodextrinase
VSGHGLITITRSDWKTKYRYLVFQLAPVSGHWSVVGQGRVARATKYGRILSRR